MRNRTSHHHNDAEGGNTGRRRVSCFLLAGLTACVMLSGCGTPRVYRDEAFRPDTPYSKRINGGEIVCTSVRRALLNQGYVVEAPTETGVLNVTKAFQHDDEMVTLRVQTTCMDNQDGSHTVYASAQQEISELQPIKQPLGLTIGPVGGITLPSGSARIPVTVKRETVQDPDFYARLYKHIQQLVDEARRR